MAQAGFTPIQLYRTTTASAQPSAGNLAAGELAINLTDKKLYAKDASNNVFLLADASSGGTTAANLAGGAAGSLPYQSGANATTFLGIGAANRVLTSSGTAPQWVTSLTGLTGVSSSSMTNTSLTPTRLVYSTTGGAQTDSANLTFDGTSLTLGGNPTLSAGTANGVLYLDGSKVATSGSALTFTGSVLGVNNSGDSDFKLTTSNTGSGSTDGLLLRINSTGSEAYLWNWEPSSVLIFGANGSEQMRLTSTGLGIGTSSPGAKLHVAGSILFPFGANGIFSDSTSRKPVIFTSYDAGSNTDYLQVGSPAVSAGVGTDIRFNTGTFAGWGEKMRLDSSGNLGLGVAPSAWVSSWRAFDIGSGGNVYSNAADNVALSANAYNFDGGSGWRYKGSGNANLFQTFSGSFAWYTAPSGTAGNAISFTQAMTLDAPVTPRLLIGTTTAGVGNNNNTNLTVAGGATVYQSLIASGSQEIYLIAQSGLVGLYARTNDPMLFGTNNQERARIPAAGGMVVGTAALATSATDGFLYVPTCAGTPTGTPTTQTGTAPIVVDTTNNKLYFYSGGQWRDAGP